MPERQPRPRAAENRFATDNLQLLFRCLTRKDLRDADVGREVVGFGRPIPSHEQNPFKLLGPLEMADAQCCRGYFKTAEHVTNRLNYKPAG